MRGSHHPKTCTSRKLAMVSQCMANPRVQVKLSDHPAMSDAGWDPSNALDTHDDEWGGGRGAHHEVSRVIFAN